MKVNCQNKSICSRFNVKHYPTIIFFTEGTLSSEEPGRDVTSILEFIQKLTTPAIIHLDSLDDLNKFRNSFGHNSFVVYYDGDTKSEWYKCIEQLAEKKYRQYFYFGLFADKNFSDSNQESTPKILVIN